MNNNSDAADPVEILTRTMRSLFGSLRIGFDVNAQGMPNPKYNFTVSSRKFVGISYPVGYVSRWLATCGKNSVRSEQLICK